MVLDVIAWGIVGIMGLIFVAVVGKGVANPPTFIKCFLVGIVVVWVIAAVGWAFVRVAGG